MTIEPLIRDLEATAARLEQKAHRLKHQHAPLPDVQNTFAHARTLRSTIPVIREAHTHIQDAMTFLDEAKAELSDSQIRRAV